MKEEDWCCHTPKVSPQTGWHLGQLETAWQVKEILRDYMKLCLHNILLMQIEKIEMIRCKNMFNNSNLTIEVKKGC